MPTTISPSSSHHQTPPENYDYDDNTSPHSSFETIAPRVAGSITVLSSITIIFIILKSPQRFTTSYHRIMTGLSFYCILAGFSIGFSNLFLPSSENYKVLYQWPQNWTIIGNVRSCEFQAFGQSCGLGCAVGYIMSLCVYYVCCLTFRMSKDTIVKRVEWLFHLVPHLIGWSFSTWQLYEKMMNPHIDLPLCFSEVYPPSCKATDLQECERGSNEVAKTTSDVGVAFLFCAIGVIVLSLSAVCTTLITRSCKPIERSDHNLAGEADEYTQVCKIGVMHCMLYLASSVISILPLLFNSDRYSHILDIWTRKVLVLLVSPLIGFYNLLVFIWGKIYGYRLLHPSVGMLEALKKLFSSEALGDESLFFSNIDIVDQEIQAEEEEVDIDIDDYDTMLRAEVQSSVDQDKSAKKADKGLDVPIAGPLSLGKQKDELDADNISLISSSLKTPAYNQLPVMKDSEEENGFFYSTPIIEKNIVVTYLIESNGCIGYNYYGQLGQSSSDTFGTPVLLNFPSSITVKPIKVVTGYDHKCTLFNDGHVWCNGSNGFQQLGDETTVNSATPVQVKKNGAVLTNVMDIEAGAYHNCAIQNTGAVYCWGFNTDGQLGLNSLADGVDQARSVVLVVLSMSATCAITASDATQVICVGYGYSSGDNASTTIDLGHAVTALTAGSTHFCALLDNTKAECWGANNQGQLGIGSAQFTSAYHAFPVFVLQDSTGTELSGITNIDSAYSSTCLVANGNPMCFGNNNYYQLGVANGGANVLYPTLVSIFDNITGKSLSSIHVGEYTGHALYNDGSVYSVGTNNGGTFRDGSAISSKNIVSDVSSAIAKQISFINGSSSPSSIPSNSPSSSPSDLPSLSPSSNPSQDPNLLGDENSHITFNDIDFGSTNSVKGIKITYAKNEINSSGSVEVKLGDASGTTLAQFSPPGTGTWVLSNIMLIPFDNTVQLSGVNSLTFTTSETTATILLISYQLIDLSERYTPFTTIHAPEVSTCSGVGTGGIAIGYFNNGDYFTYSPIDFGLGTNSIQITYSKDIGTGTGTFEIRKGNHETGEIIGTYSPANTGSWGTYATVEIPIKTSYGIDQLTFRGTGTYPYGIMNLKSFQLSPDTAGYICLDPTARTHTASVQAAASAQTGANLVSIRCSAQQNAVASMSITTGTWIGGNDSDNEGVWVLPDGSAMTYFNWNAGEPNNAGDEDCIVIGSDGLWFDEPCNSGTVTGPAIFESTFAIAGLTCIEYVECQDSVKIVENGIQTADTRLRNNNLVNQSDTAGTYLSVPGNSISPNDEDNWNVYNLPIGANDDFVLLAKMKVDGSRSGAGTGGGESCQGYQGGGGQSTTNGGTYGGVGAGGFDSTAPNGVGGPGGRAGGGGGGSGGNAPRDTGIQVLQILVEEKDERAGGFSDSSTISGAGGSGVVIRYPLADPGYICLQTSLLSWQSSQDAAVSSGANLVSIRCAEQTQRLTELNSSNQVWVGGTDSASEGDWVFLDGRGSVTYTNWGTGQPNNSYGNENCMGFNKLSVYWIME